MLDNFRFETFVDVHSNIFAEYLSSVIAKLPKENPEYRSIEERIEELYKEYPKVMAVLDTEKPSDLSEQECKALIEVLELRNRLSDMQQEAIYFRGCYDSVGYRPLTVASITSNSLSFSLSSSASKRLRTELFLTSLSGNMYSSTDTPNIVTS